MHAAQHDRPSVPAWRQWHGPDEEIRIGVSACLLGDEVRFDGGHKHDRYLTGVLGHWVRWVPVCPEVEIGLGVPRPTIRLESRGETIHLVEPKSGNDLTERMAHHASQRIEELRRLQLDGFVLKKGSPSCGMERVRVYGPKGGPRRDGVGLFAQALLDAWPNLPVEEEGRLNDPPLRESFIERVFASHRWRNMMDQGPSRARLVQFHTAHKMLLRSHNEASYRRLGRLVAAAGTVADDELFRSYQRELFLCLRTRATVKRHANVLYHAVGYLKRVLGSWDRHELISLIEDYRAGLVPLIVPITLLRHHVHKHRVAYLCDQLYLEPHPKELMLRNRV